MQEMRDLYLLRALKEGGHKWSPSVKATVAAPRLKAIASSLRVPLGRSSDSTVLQNVDRSLDRGPRQREMSQPASSGRSDR